MNLAIFLSGRPGAILLTAVIFMFLIGVHITGHATAEINTIMGGFGGALLGALSNDLLKTKPEEPKQVKDEVNK